MVMNLVYVIPTVIGVGASIGFLSWLYNKLPKGLQEEIPRVVTRTLFTLWFFFFLKASLFDVSLDVIGRVILFIIGAGGLYETLRY